MPELVLDVQVVVFSVSEDKLRVLLAPFRLPPNTPPLEGETERGEVCTLPGIPVQPEESLDDGAGRAIAPHIDRHQAYLEQLYTYGNPNRLGPEGRSVSVAYFALVPAHAFRGDSSEAAWFPLLALPALTGDHADIIAYALRRLRYKLEYSAAAFQLMPEEFSLSELQHTYEIILGEKLDKRNFRRRILEAAIIEPTPHRRVGEGRPARLYRYRPDAVAEVKARRLFP